MPVLLDSTAAPSLAALLAQLQAASGLQCIVPDSFAERVEQLKIRGLGSLEQAGAAELSFLANPKLGHLLAKTRAAAVFLRADDLHALESGQVAYEFLPVVCEEPYFAYAVCAQWFAQQRQQQLPKGIHPTAQVHPSVELGADVYIGPFAVIEAHVVIGTQARIEAGVYIGQDSRIGAQSHIYPNASLYHATELGARCIIHSGVVIGADGFGFAPHPQKTGSWAKIAQLGPVIIGDDVEIGANTTIDRGALDATVIGSGVKLDNQIMVAHNVQIGDHTAIAACVGIAGSTRIGQRCIIGGAAMISGHLDITDDVQISGGTAITASIREPGHFTGVYPFHEHKQWQRNAAVISQLSLLRKRIRALERAVQESEK
ncbi:MAG TPA: UDP-3-O-(3-hydroxymyristoyl)glucosamine N-acyltransferase [Paenalcaligenes sp.]|nr:UDP-3-O-(3-hydroxymyristoyl)glucosamine N-acyltransferase [Paenalcaligenes sp.]